MTRQQEADQLLQEHQGKRMALFDYDQTVKPHLVYIEAGASMAARHAAQLPCKPDFTTHAQDELAETRKVLEAALRNIVTAQEVYAGKPLENA